MQCIGSLIRKEFRQVFRDRPMMVIIFIAPVLQLLILSYAVTTEVRNIKLLVIDLDRSITSREVERAFSQGEHFDLVGTTTDLHQVGEKMKGWQAQAALVIPVGFHRDLQKGLEPQLQLVMDGVDGNTAGVALGYAQGILMNVGERFLLEPTNQSLLSELHLVRMEERLLYNPNLSSKQFMVPAIVVVLLTILPMMLSSMSLVKEKEIGTLEQLMVTPLKKHELLLGKLIPFLILSYVELAVVMTVAVFVFKISMHGSYALVALLAFFYMLTTLGLGIFVSTVTSSQQQAMFVSWFFMVFMIIMSGIFIPIQNMPIVMQKLAYLDPMRYFVAIVRDIFQKGSSLKFLLKDAIPMMLFGLVIFPFGVMKFRKRVR
ncbi:MAG: ABC transporter permease [bacterium]